MVVVGELVASAVVDGLLSTLRSGLWSELGLLWNFNDDLQDMKTTLESIGAVLNHAEKKSFNEEPVRLWLKRLKDAAYDIEDMLDELLTQTQKHSEFQVFKLYFSILVMAHKLKGMKKRLNKIAEERNKYSLREEAITDQQQLSEGRETYSTVNIRNVLGREDEAKDIINMLLSSTSDTISVIPIVGLGGLGKTTLAKLIFKHEKIEKAFEPRIWVHAADFNVEKLAEAILSSSETGNGNRFTTLESKTEGAKKILDGKKFLIVLDDVWNEKKQKWVDFKEILQDGKKESKILVTTRSERVSSIMDATETTHQLQPLSDDNCLKLFNQMAFESADAKDSYLESIGEEIVKKCRGVPLTANALGGMLHFKKGEAAWKKVRDSDLWELKEDESNRSQLENKIMSSLKLSYQQMRPPLKLCFVYCSLYPRAFELDREVLIQQWIAQRFIQALQDGDDYVNYLLSISFLEEKEEINWRGVKNRKIYMKMHDLVYDLARWVAEDEVSVLDAMGSGKDNAMECRYASVINCNEASNASIFCQQPTYMKRHDLVSNLARWVYGVEILGVLESGKYNEAFKELLKALPRKVRALHFHKFSSSLPQEIFSYTKCLRVLDFSSCSLYKLPTSIYRLKQLRYLRLPDCLFELDERIGKLYNLIYLETRSLSKIPNSIGSLQRLNSLKLANCRSLTSLPESLGDLVNLVTLDINNCSIITLPHSIWKLQKLNSLKLYGCDNLGSLPESLGYLMELRTLDVRGCAMLDLDELRKATCNMRDLKIQRDEPLELFEFDTSDLMLHLIDGPEEEHVVRHVTDAKRINLKERGGSLKSLSYKCGGYKKGQAVEDMLEALQPHQNLQELQFSNYGGSMFPSWMMSQMESFLPNLVKITLTDISNCEHLLPVLGQLPKLEEIVISLCGARNTTAGASFPSLKRLELKYMYELEEWVTAAMAGDDGERGASLFPCLEHLTIRDCSKLLRIHPCIPPSVRRLSLSGDNLHLLTFLDVPEMPLLKHLEIWYYDLDIFPESIRRLTSLETLELNWCKSLTTFPEWLGELSQLQHLEIYKCPLIDRLPQSIRRLTSLETLELKWCESLTTFPEWLGELSQLQHLVLEHCPLIDRLPQSIQGLTALKRLRILGCSKSLRERTRKETGEDWDKISHIGEINIW